MSQPPDRNPPAVRASEAVRAVEAAVGYIRERCGVRRVDLVGWSWGAVLAGMYTAEHPERVGKLVLYGAITGLLTADAFMAERHRP